MNARQLNAVTHTLCLVLLGITIGNITRRGFLPGLDIAALIIAIGGPIALYMRNRWGRFQRTPDYLAIRTMAPTRDDVRRYGRIAWSSEIYGFRPEIDADHAARYWRVGDEWAPSAQAFNIRLRIRTYGTH